MRKDYSAETEEPEAPILFTIERREIVAVVREDFSYNRLLPVAAGLKAIGDVLDRDLDAGTRNEARFSFTFDNRLIEVAVNKAE